VAAWVKKVEGRNFQFSDRQQRRYDAQMFNFAPKFSQNGGFLAPNCLVLEQSFLIRRKFL